MVDVKRVGESMNITKKLLLAFSLLILSLIGTNLIAVFSLSKISNAQDYFQANILPSLDAMNKEMLKVTSIRSQLYLHGLTQDAAGMAEVQQKRLKCMTNYMPCINIT